MSRHHNTKHRRGRSNYPARLAKRGLTKAPRMTPYSPEILEAIHRREERTQSTNHPRPPRRFNSGPRSGSRAERNEAA